MKKIASQKELLKLIGKNIRNRNILKITSYINKRGDFVVYIKLENNMDKFMENSNLPKSIRKMSFKSKCRNGKFKIEKLENVDFIILPQWNQKVLRKLKNVANIRCWKNVCVSDNLRKEKEFIKFAKENNLKVMDGKWLFKNMVDQVLEYLVMAKDEVLVNQEITILCHTLDETIVEKIKEICVKVKICNILTNQTKQFQKLEEEVYQTNGIVLNVSKNYKRVACKSNIVINFDFPKRDFEKCIFAKTAYFINVGKNMQLDGKDLNQRNIIFLGIDMPEKYVEYLEVLEGFNSSILYESFIYKKTSYQNIKKELLGDDAKILYLKDSNQKLLTNSNLNLPKTLDKMTI